MNADPTAAPSTPAPARDRRLRLLVAIVVDGVLFGLLAGVAFAAWAGALLGAVGALVVGLALAWLLPLFLAVRANLALRRKRPDGVLLRRLTALFLVVLVQTTVFLAGFVHLGQGQATTTQELSAAALPLLGALPGVGPWLADNARQGGLLPDDAKAPPKTPPKTPGPGPDGGTPAPDAGAPVVDAGPASAPSPAGLQPRAGGRPTATVAAAATTTEGDVVVVVWSVLFGGQATPRLVELAALSALGPVTRVEASSDGFVAVVLGGGQLVTAPPSGLAIHDKALSRGARLGDLELQGLRDVAIGPGGALLVVADLFDARTSKTTPALVARPAGGGAAFVVRKAGDVVDPPEKKGEAANVAHGFSIKRGDGSGAVVVEEEVLEGGDDAGTKLSGAQWTMNPRRLLAGQLDNPRALVEVARTGAEPSGLDGTTLQGFGDAVLLADGRVVFDANAVEEGARGWLFSARAGGGVFAVAPELVGKPEAPWSPKAPRVRQLAIAGDGVFAFVNRDGAVVVGPLARPADAKTGVLRADALRRGDGARAGSVATATTVRTTGGDWLVAGVDLLGEGGARAEAVVLLGRDDLAAGRAEVLLEQGGPLPAPSTPLPPAPVDAGPKASSPTTPTTPTTPSRRVKSIFFDDGHDEPLWQPG
jgi:hypothetical protein